MVEMANLGRLPTPLPRYCTIVSRDVSSKSQCSITIYLVFLSTLNNARELAVARGYESCIGSEKRICKEDIWI